MIYGNAPRQRSPWFYVGIGIIVLLAGGLLFVIVMGILLVNFFKQSGKNYLTEMHKPVTRQDLVMAFRDVPFYPGVDVKTDETFRQVRASVRLMKHMGNFKEADTATLTTSDPPDKVLLWYNKSLTGAGYTTFDTQSTTKEDYTTSTVTYQKAQDFVSIQVIEPLPNRNKKTLILLFRFDQVKQGVRPPTIPEAKPGLSR